MTSREQIETLLKINGSSIDATDDEIRSILNDAKYSNDEIVAAIAVLRQNIDTSSPRLDGLHKVFYTDKPLQAGEVAGLLGIDVNVLHKLDSHQVRRRQLSGLQLIFVVFVAFTFAFLGTVYYMYKTDIGVFHPTAAAAFKHRES